MCGLLLFVAACGSGSPEESNGELNSQEDVQRLFEAIVPDLVDAFTQLASQQSFTSLASAKQGEGPTSTVQCPGGGTLVVNLETGQATLNDCGVAGVVISASLALFVSPTGPSSYQAAFNGILMVTGSFTGTVEVNSALVQWTDPPSANSTFWEATVTVNGQVFFVSSEGADNVCPSVELNNFSGLPGEACDDATDCQSSSCRDPIQNPSEGCTCRNLDGGPNPTSCTACLGVNAAPPNAEPNVAVDCGEGPAVDFTCNCVTQSGETFPFFISGGGECLY
jgi:hypothetical protein